MVNFDKQGFLQEVGGGRGSTPWIGGIKQIRSGDTFGKTRVQGGCNFREKTVRKIISIL